MPRFEFVARDRFGASRTGTIEQPSFESARSALRQRNWSVVQIKPVTTSSSSLLEDLRPRNWLPARMVDVELGLRQLSVMLTSGLPLLEALRLLHEHAERRSMADIWKRVADDVLAGDSVAVAMQRHPRFPPIAVQLTRIGEETGELQETQRRAAAMLEYRRRLRNQVLSALAYPVVVFIAALFIAGFMVFSVIPKVQAFLRSLGKGLPKITQMLVDVTNYINAHIVEGSIVVGCLIVAVIAVRYFPSTRLLSDRLLLRVPVVGNAIRLGGTASFARNLQTLLQSGLSLLDSLKSIESLLGNRYLSSELAHARAAVIDGETLARSLTARGVFQPMLPRIVAIGESAGRLDDVLGDAATFFEEELARVIRLLAALVEPAMLLIVGGMVGFVYIAFFMALFAAGGR